jgi:hypothetical protein
MSYFAPGQPEFHHLRHLQLICWQPGKPPTASDLLAQVARVTPGGKPTAWFFDSFLILPPCAPSGNFLYADVNIGTTRSGAGDFYAVVAPNPATARDWSDMLDSLLAAGGLVHLLDGAVATAARAIGRPPHPRNIVIPIPYPHPNQSLFGAVGGRGIRPLNFSIAGQNLDSASEQRLAACRWFVSAVRERWCRARPRHLHLLGFYWTYESLRYSWDVDDHWVMKELYKHLCGGAERLFWIPFYSSFNVHLLGPGRGFYFDAAFLQPNHMFYREIRGVRRAAEQARERGAGVEIEYYLEGHDMVSVGRDRHRRLRNYLNGGVKYGYMTDSACAYYLGANDLPKMARSRDPVERGFYDDLFRFVEGSYAPPG